MREKTIEKKFGEKVRADGGLFLKFTSPNNAGVPDRLVVTASGEVYFVEFKAPGKQLRPLQEYWRSELVVRGVRVEVVDHV